ncbi:hypothetical protein Hamer_G010020, partial [Homarus americanus]
SIVTICGREPKIPTQQDGSLLVEVSSLEENARFHTLSEVPCAPVSCTLHATFNQCRGVIFSKELLRYQEEKLLEELRIQKVKCLGAVCCFHCSEAHPASSSECDQFRIEKEIQKIHTRDKKHSTDICLKAWGFLCRHKALQTAAATPPREKSVTVLNSAPTPDSMPPILSPQTFLVVVEVLMDEADTSATPHLSSTRHPGTTRISAKCYLRGLRVSGVLPTSQVPCWRLDKADWDLFKELVKIDKIIEEYPSIDDVVEYLASLLQLAGHCSIPRTSGHIACRPVPWAHDGSSVAPPQEVAELIATAFSGCLLWQLDPQSLS